MATAPFIAPDAPVAAQPAERAYSSEHPTVRPVEESKVPQVAVRKSRPRQRPNQILLATLSTSGFRMLQAIPAQLRYDATGVTASWEEIDEFGTGSSMSAACEDLGRTVAELYRSLREEQGNLGPDLQQVWSKLQDYLAPRR